jgi:hypothetical protein
MAGTFGSEVLQKNIRDMVERSQMTPEQRKAEEWMREHDLTGVAPSWLYAHIGVGTP